MEDCRACGCGGSPHGVAHAPESARRDRRRGDGRPHQPHHERARARARSACRRTDGRSSALSRQAGPASSCGSSLVAELTNLTEAGLEGASAGRSGRRRLADRLPGRRATARRRQAQGSSRLVVPARGGMPRPVFESTPPPFAFAPAWFPNQKDLVFSGGNGIFAVAAAGNEMPRRLVPAATCTRHGGRRTGAGSRTWSTALSSPSANSCSERSRTAGSSSTRTAARRRSPSPTGTRWPPTRSAQQPDAAVHRQPPRDPRHLSAARQPSGPQHRRSACSLVRLGHQRPHDVALGRRQAARLLFVLPVHRHPGRSRSRRRMGHRWPARRR